MLSEIKSFFVFNLYLNFRFRFRTSFRNIFIYKVKDLKVENAWDVEHVKNTKVTIVLLLVSRNYYRV